MPTFNYAFTVNAPLSAVSRFHHDTTTLKKLTPPPLFVQFHRLDPLAEGAVSDFTLWFGPIPIRWTAVHSDVDADRGFTDTQVRGPMRLWRHRHSFHPEPNGHTRIHEHLKYQHPSGWRGLLTRLLFSRLTLFALFTYRRLATRRALRHLPEASTTDLPHQQPSGRFPL
jgi:ligand-binding SRPBCC domain-containing protein